MSHSNLDTIITFSGSARSSTNGNNSAPIRRSSYASVVTGQSHRTSSVPTSNPSSLQPYSIVHPLDSEVFMQPDPVITSKPTDILRAKPKAATMKNANRIISMDEPDEFFIPSYLVESGYAVRLQQAYSRALVKFLKDQPFHSSRPASPLRSLSISGGTFDVVQQTDKPKRLSSWSNNETLANLSTSPSHKGISHKVIERSYQPDPNQIQGPPQPLPSRWAATDKGLNLDLSQNGLQATYNSLAGGSRSIDEGSSLRADHPMPPMAGIYYFEVTLLTKQREGLVSIGFMGPKVLLTRVPGWEPDSWGYHGDDGHVHTTTQSHSTTQTGKPYKDPYRGGDTIGCGINFRTRTCFFTKNGLNCGVAFKDLKTDLDYYPAVGLKKDGEAIKVNFGQTPFLFDIKSVYEKERESIMADFKKADINELNPPDSETDLLKKLVLQHLTHSGYHSAAHAFVQEVNTESAYLRGDKCSAREMYFDEAPHTINQQSIRMAILSGKIDSALKMTERCYPDVLSENMLIHFRLKCLKFLEMTRISLEGYEDPNAKEPEYNETPLEDDNDDVFGHEMDLDDGHTNGDGSQDWGVGSSMQLDEDYRNQTFHVGEIEDEVRDEDMVDKHQKHPVTNSDLFLYCRILQKEYGDVSSKEIRDELQKIMGLIGFTNVHEHPLKELLDSRNREVIADSLVKAITISLGRNPHSTLEMLYKQTGVLIGEIAEDGGPGATIYFPQDILGSKPAEKPGEMRLH